MKKLLILLLGLLILLSSKPVEAGNAGNCIFYQRTAWVFVVGEKSNGELYPTEKSCRTNINKVDQQLDVPDFRILFRRLA